MDIQKLVLDLEAQKMRALTDQVESSFLRVATDSSAMAALARLFPTWFLLSRDLSLVHYYAQDVRERAQGTGDAQWSQELCKQVVDIMAAAAHCATAMHGLVHVSACVLAQPAQVVLHEALPRIRARLSGPPYYDRLTDCLQCTEKE